MQDELLRFVAEEDRSSDFVQSTRCYELYEAYARLIDPRTILEIGTYRGYSLLAMLLGGGSVERVHCFDNESYGVELRGAIRAAGEFRPDVQIEAHVVDTSTLKSMAEVGSAELIHVDGDHSEQGALRDLELVREVMSPDGVIVVDDVVAVPEVASSVHRFLSERSDLQALFVPALRGHLLLASPATIRRFVGSLHW